MTTKQRFDKRFGLENPFIDVRGGTPIDVRKLPSLTAIQEQLIDRKLYRFMEYFWDIVEPGSKFMHGWHIEAICNHLEAVAKGQIKRLIINIPPRCCKSLTVSVFWPAWIWSWRPETRMLFASHKAELAVRDCVNMRRLVSHEKYTARYPFVQFTPDQNLKAYYRNTMAGERRALGVGTGATGDGGDIVVVDDPHNAKDALTSAVSREEVIEWWEKTMSTRLNPGSPIAAKAIIMQRLHDNDLVGHILRRMDEMAVAFDKYKREASLLNNISENEYNKLTEITAEDFKESDYEILCLPAQYSPTHPIKSKTSLNFVDPRTNTGELLWEAGLPLPKIKELRITLGAAAASGQLDQLPIAEGGGELKSEWWRKLEKFEWPTKFDEEIQAWDLSYSDDPTADFTAGFVLGRVGSNIYIKARMHRQLAFTQQLKAVEVFTELHPNAARKLVEKAANARALQNTLQSTVPGIILLPSTDSKEARAWAWSPYLEAGNIFVPAWEPWVDSLISECAKFPAGTHDDQVDAVGIGILYLINNRTGTPSVKGLRMAPSSWRQNNE